MAPYLTAADVAALLDVDHTTVYRLAASGALPSTRVLGRWRFEPAVVRAALAGADRDRLALLHAACAAERAGGAS